MRRGCITACWLWLSWLRIVLNRTTPFVVALRMAVSGTMVSAVGVDSNISAVQRQQSEFIIQCQ